MFYDDKVDIDSEATAHLCEKTLGQSENSDWRLLRKYRITSSTAHRILKANKKETRHKYFNEHNKDDDDEGKKGAKSWRKNLQYGKLMEVEARRKYEAVTGHKVLENGLIISPSQPWLACSPDGIISGDEPFALEIKCPSSCENKKIVTDYIKDGKLKKSHPYYTQCQIHMYVTGLKKCDFFVWSKIDHILDHIELDMDFLEKSIIYLEKIYFTELLTTLFKQAAVVPN